MQQAPARSLSTPPDNACIRVIVGRGRSAAAVRGGAVGRRAVLVAGVLGELFRLCHKLVPAVLVNGRERVFPVGQQVGDVLSVITLLCCALRQHRTTTG